MNGKDIMTCLRMGQSYVHSSEASPDVWSCKCKFFCVYRPYKESISKGMNNDLNLYSITKLIVRLVSLLYVQLTNVMTLKLQMRGKCVLLATTTYDGIHQPYNYKHFSWNLS